MMIKDSVVGNAILRQSAYFFSLTQHTLDQQAHWQ